MRLISSLLLATVVLSTNTAAAADGCMDGVERRVLQMLANDAAPGIAVRIDHRGKVILDIAHGDLKPRQRSPLPRDAIYAIYSMTKPVTSVAAFILIERGKMALDDPISKFLPGFAEMTVGSDAVPAERQITVADLMRHTSGITYGFFGFGSVRSAYESADVGSRQITNAESTARIASLPLEHHPGVKWEYSRSHDVLGHLIEVVSSEPLDVFLQREIFEPLKMTDTTFWVRPENHHRIAGSFDVLGDFSKPVKRLSGGGGLQSTMDDFHNFLVMMRAGGRFGERQIISEESARQITSDQTLSQGIEPGKYYLPGSGHGFGYGVAVKTSDGGFEGPVGTWHWAGYGGTSFWVDPLNGLIVIAMLQTRTNRGGNAQAIRQQVYNVFNTDGTPGMNCPS